MPPLVSVISCACNQGDWVRKTVPLIRQSLGDWPHEIIIVDDQSEDGCCTGLDQDVLILTTHARTGVSAGRRLAVRNARGDIYLFTDPHCQYEADALKQLVQLAADKQAICEPKTTGLPRVSRVRFGGKLAESDRGLRVGYCLRHPHDWPALLGTIYAVQEPLYEYLGGWPELPGVWGTSEQALTLSAWYAGVPIHVDTRYTCNHQHYHPKTEDGHDRFAYHVSMKDHANNAHWVHAGFFPKTYEHHWKPVLKERFRDREHYWDCLGKRGWESKDPGVGRRTITKFRQEIANRSLRTEEDFYRLVLGKEMPREIPTVDPAYLAQQRKRSKPRTYGTIQRRQARAVDWFVNKVPGCIRGLKVLDLGSRDGFVVARLKEMEVLEAEGVELVPETAEFARNTLGRNVKAGDMRHLPYKDGEWHRVFCIHTLEHLPDPENGVREMLRVLMRGGWFLIVVPVEDPPKGKSGHNSSFKDEQTLIDLVKKFPVDKIQTEVKGLSPKPNQEILLVGRKRR